MIPSFENLTLNLGIITFLCLLTYFYTLRCGFVSDDIAGIAEYDGKLQGFEYGMLWRWVRYNICGGNFPSQYKDQSGKPIPQGKLPKRHHILSLIVFIVTCWITYLALTPIIGSKLALLSVLIVIVHPCSTQGVAWISGLAYPLSLLWISLSIILMQFFYAHQTINHAIWVIPTFCAIQFFAIHAIFATTAMTWAVLLFLGYWQFAILAFVISAAMCFDQIRKTVSFRVEEFKKQHMAASTVFGWRKVVVAMKTLWYYTCHAVAPIKMGLYHEWGFHYDKQIERTDWMFWRGLLLFGTLSYAFFAVDSVAVKLAILWFFAFSTGFWNWITAQQFVTERYIMVANLGLGIALAYFTQNCFWLYCFVLGVYLCRTWTHLPTYDNELRFYESNRWNFQNSEVALGNLGVTYARIGLEDSAKDSWRIATQINPEYDVPWINIFYQMRTKALVFINNGNYDEGMRKLQESIPFIEKALACKICHFPEQWKSEHIQLLNSIRNPNIVLQEELKRLLGLKDELKRRVSLAASVQELSGIQESIVNNERQMDNLVSYFHSHNLPVTDTAPFNRLNADRSLEKITRRT